MCASIWLLVHSLIPVQAGGIPKDETLRFPANRHMKVVRLTDIRTGRFYPKEIFIVLISVRG